MISLNMKSKIKKVPKDNQGDKSRKDTASSGKLISTIGSQASPKGLKVSRRLNVRCRCDNISNHASPLGQSVNVLYLFDRRRH